MNVLHILHTLHDVYLGCLLPSPTFHGIKQQPLVSCLLLQVRSPGTRDPPPRWPHRRSCHVGTGGRMGAQLGQVAGLQFFPLRQFQGSRVFIWLFVSFYIGLIWLSSDCQSGCCPALQWRRPRSGRHCVSCALCSGGCRVTSASQAGLKARMV